MTNDEMDRDLHNAIELVRVHPLGSRITRVDRSRHECTTETAIWLFQASGAQVGSISRSGAAPHVWRAHAIMFGLPTTEFRCDTLADAVAHILVDRKLA